MNKKSFELRDVHLFYLALAIWGIVHIVLFTLNPSSIGIVNFIALGLIIVFFIPQPSEAERKE